MRKLFLVLICIVFLYSPSLIAQDDNKLDVNLANILLDEHGEELLKGYLQPFVTAFGTGMGGALYHRAYTKGFPRLDVGVSAVYLSIPDEDKTFTYLGNEFPTVFGKGKEGNVSGIDFAQFALPQIQINLGLFANFELMARGFPTVNLTDVGEISLLGFGVKYGLTDLIPIPAFPIDLSVQAMYQSFKVSNWISAGTFGMNVHASKGVPILPLDVYAGIGFESTSLTLKTDNLPLEKVQPGLDGIGDVTIDGENAFRMNLGLSFTFLLINAHVDYNIGTYNSLGGGVMIVF